MTIFFRLKILVDNSLILYELDDCDYVLHDN